MTSPPRGAGHDRAPRLLKAALALVAWAATMIAMMAWSDADAALVIVVLATLGLGAAIGRAWIVSAVLGLGVAMALASVVLGGEDADGVSPWWWFLLYVGCGFVLAFLVALGVLARRAVTLRRLGGSRG